MSPSKFFIPTNLDNTLDFDNTDYKEEDYTEIEGLLDQPSLITQTKNESISNLIDNLTIILENKSSNMVN